MEKVNPLEIPGSRYDPLRKYRMCKQVMIIFIWFSLGLCNGIPESTVYAIQRIFDIGESKISQLFLERNIGNIVGIIAGGLGYSAFPLHGDIIMFIGVCGTSSIAFIPWIRRYSHMKAIFFITGIFDGTINVVGITMMWIIWKQYSAFPLFLSQFLYGLGHATAHQVIVNLSPHRKSVSYNKSFSSLSYDVSHGRNIPYVELERTMAFSHGYITAGVVTFGGAVCYLYFVLREVPVDLQPNRKLNRDTLNPASCGNDNVGYSLQLFSCLIIYFIHFGGALYSFSGSLVNVISRSKLELSTQETSLLVTSFWMSCTCAHFVAGLLAMKFSIAVIIFLASSLSLVSIIAMLLYGTANNLLMWIFTILHGASMGVLFPGGIAWSNRYLHMNCISAMILLVSYATGKIIYETIAEFILNNYSVDDILYVPTACSIFVWVSFLFLSITVNFKHRLVFRHITANEEMPIKSSSESETYGSCTS